MQWGCFVQDRELAKDWRRFWRNVWACRSGSGITATRSFGQYISCEHGLKYFFLLLWTSCLFVLDCYTLYFKWRNWTSRIIPAEPTSRNLFDKCCYTSNAYNHFFQTLLKKHVAKSWDSGMTWAAIKPSFFYFRNYFVFQVNISQADMQAIGNTITMVTQDGTTITVPAHDAVISSAGTHSVAMVTAEGTEGQQVRYYPVCMCNVPL